MARACQYALFDGTFLHRPNSIVVLMNAESQTIVSGKYGVRENSDTQLKTFLDPLKAVGMELKSCTVDGNPQAMRTFRSIWPNIIIQRCLVHVQRQGLMWCRRYPKRRDAKQLRKLFLKITFIQTVAERDRLLDEVAAWERQFGSQIATSPEKGRVSSDVKRARSMLLKALPDMFHYLHDPNIPWSTNGLEGYFSRLKQRYRNHRGMQPTKLGHYFDWYFHFSPR